VFSSDANGAGACFGSRRVCHRRWPSGGREVPVEGTEPPLHDDYVYALRDEEAYLQDDDENRTS